MPLRILIWFVAAAFLFGCEKPPAPIAAEPPKPVLPPMLYHLPGIAGKMQIDKDLIGGLMQGGVTRVATCFAWNDGRRGLPSLNGYDENQQQAIRLAKSLTSSYRADPRRRITLTAHSGGTAIAVWALEHLPPDVQVDYVVLLASALSPDYDLSSALRHVRGKAYAFYSEHDYLVLGTGTRTLGTMDRVRTNAAGYVGFSPAPKADAGQYAKLTQFAYDPAWRRYGNYGDHIGVMSIAFAREFIAPLLDPPWTKQTLATQPETAPPSGVR